MFQKAASRLALIAAAALSPLVLHAEGGPAPLKGGYTVAFPEKPAEKEVAPSPGSKTTVYSVNRSDASFVSGYTEYAKNVDLTVELAADIDAFVKSIGAEVTGQKRTDLISAKNGRMPRVDFTFEGEHLAGRGLAVVTTPRSVIMVSAFAAKPGSQDETARFVDSFRLAE